MKNKIFKAKYETFEFIAADSFLVGGGFLVGTDLIDSSISTPIGGALVAIGLFLGLRVLWKFSSDLKETKKKVDYSTTLLDKTIFDVKKNASLLNGANRSLTDTQRELKTTQRELQTTKKELQRALHDLKESEKKIFGHSGSTFSRSSGFNPLDKTVDELKRKVDKLEQESNRTKRGW